jgi:hypothetical protein
MAIELIEDNELGALAQSRLGNKCFIDDDDKYANVFGIRLGSFITRNVNSAFGTILSSLSRDEKEQRKQEAKQQVDSVWKIDEKKVDDCEYLTTRLAQLQANIESELAKNPSKTTQERTINPLADWEGRYKSNIIRNKCVEKKLAKEQADEEKKNAEILKQTALDTTQFNIPEIKGTSNTSKYIILGVGGLTLAIVIIAILRR